MRKYIQNKYIQSCERHEKNKKPRQRAPFDHGNHQQQHHRHEPIKGPHAPLNIGNGSNPGLDFRKRDRESRS